MNVIEPSLFDEPTLAGDLATEAGETAMSSAADHAGEWVQMARGFVKQYLRDHPLLFCDDVWDAGLEVPVEKRAFGAVMAWAQREGFMVPSGDARRSKASRGSLRPVYRSLLHGAYGDV